MATRSGRVHVATTRREYKGKVYETVLLRRTYREDGRVRHETLGNISHLPAEIIDLVRRSLAGEQFVSSNQAWSIEKSTPHGHVEAVLGTIRRLELDSLIAGKRSRERDLVLAMIAERLLAPCSKLATTRQWHSTTLAEELGVVDCDEDDLYRAMDWLLARQGEIERRLAKCHLSEGSIALYDVTSSYYEGKTCPLAKRGHDRDGKKGLPIVVYGLLTSNEGCPVAVQVYEGNTGDPATVADQVDKIRHRFDLSRIVLVGDRGMLTSARIDTLRELPGVDWISALRSPSIRALVDQGRIQPSLFDKRNLAEISSPDFPDERLVVCFNPLLEEERRRKRESLLAATEKELARISKAVTRRKTKVLKREDIGLKLGKVINRFHVAKHFALKIQDGSFEWSRKQSSIEKESRLDGIYVIRTSVPKKDLSAPDAVRQYKGLAHVERAFRCLKGVDLLVRPIHHHTEDHVRAHIFICMLAYYVEWHMRRALAPILFQDEDLQESRSTRDPVMKPQPSPSVQAKKRSHVTPDGLPVHSFRSLLANLGTRCRSLCAISSGPSPVRFAKLTELTSLQARAFQLLQL